jgi:uncharacterized protein with FMN-binding domain
MSAFPARPLRRVAVSAFATVTGVLLLLALKPHATAGAGGVTAQRAVPAQAPSASTPSPAAGGSTGTRTVDGDTVQTQYGPVRLRITLTGGKITAVTTLQLPDNNSRDQEIAGFAVPQLTREALTAQSAHIDTVSGATYTSQGYIQSLQSALDRAGG